MKLLWYIVRLAHVKIHVKILTATDVIQRNVMGGLTPLPFRIGLTYNINKLVPNVATNVTRNPPFYYFTSLSVALLTPSFNKPDTAKFLIISMIYFISLFEIIGAPSKHWTLIQHWYMLK